MEKWVPLATIVGTVGTVIGVLIALWSANSGDSGPGPTSAAPTYTASAAPTITVGPDTTDSPPAGWGQQSGNGSNSAGSQDNASGDGAVQPTVAAPPVAPQPAITRVDVTPRGGGALTQIGPTTWQLPHYVRVIPPPNITFDWSSQGPSGELSGVCTVSATIDGRPGSDYPVSRQSGECSGSPNQRLTVYDPGTYTITVTVTPPDGGAPVTGQETFTLVAT